MTWMPPAAAASVAFTLYVAAAAAWDFSPLELRDVPVNGTDRTEAPEALKGIHGFGDRPANKLVEHGGALALSDQVRGVETPHLDWAVRYSESPLRVLWVVDPKYAARAPLEIRARSSFDVELLMIPQDLREYPEDKGMQRYFSQRFDELLSRDYDVIVLEAYDPRVWRKPALHPLLASVYERIDRMVRNGCGLICKMGNSGWHQGNREDLASYHELSPITYGHAPVSLRPARANAASPLSDGLSFAAWPPCKVSESKLDADATLLASAGDRPMLATRTHGKGRVVGIHYLTPMRGMIGLVPESDSNGAPLFGDYYEAVYPLWLRALAWAGGKPPRIGLEVADLTTCNSGDRPVMTITVNGGADTPGSVTLRYQLTDPFGDRITQADMPVNLRSASATVTPELPILHANGLYRLDLWIEAGDRIWNWGTAALRVEGGAALAVEPLGERVAPGEPAEYRIKTDASGDLHVLAVDGIDRVFCDRKFNAVANGDVVRIDTTLSVALANRVFFTMLASDGRTILARRGAKLYLPRIGLGSLDGQFLIASYGNTLASEHLQPAAGLLYRAAGFGAIYYNWHSRERLKMTAEQGLGNIAGRSWMFAQKGFSKVHHLTPNDPKNREKWAARIAELARDVHDFGGIGRVLDEEHWFAYTAHENGAYRGAQSTQDKWSMALFRDAMREKYGAIAALNDAWGTEFPGFDEIRVIEEDGLKGSDNPSGWIEFREYMNWTFANRYYGWLAEQHATLIGEDYGAGPGAPNWTTAQGGPVYRGGDMQRMNGNMNFMMLYGGGSPGFAFTGQPGGQKYDPPQMWQGYGAWKHVLTGADALWYYFGDAIVGSELAWRRHAEWIQTGIGDIVRGCGALLSGADRVGSHGVRVLNTSENKHMGWLFAKRDDGWRALGLDGGTPVSERTFRTIMGSLFISTGDITEEAIAADGLADCKLLVLPQQVNIGDAAVAAIREYVRNGGAVMADIMPATRHRLGKPRGNSALADVFGVDFSEARIHVETKSWNSVGIESPAEANIMLTRDLIWLPGQVSFTGLKPTTAVAHARLLSKSGPDTAGCFVNAFGAGRALLLNFAHGELNDETIGYHRMFGQRLLEWAGIEASERIVDPLTLQPLAHRPLYRFTRGKATLLGSLRGSHKWSGPNVVMFDPGRLTSIDDKAMFTWSGKRHITDVRTGDYLGFNDSATIDLPSYKAKLLCLLPYRVMRVNVEGPATVNRGDHVSLQATVETDGEAPGEHVLYFEVTSPTGARRPLYCKTRTAPEGRAELTIPLALNDPAGEWMVMVRDVMTGAEGRISALIRRSSQ